MKQAERFDIVEVAHAGKAHAYFLYSPMVSTDILFNLKYGAAPGDRGLVREAEAAIWDFPEDYEERVRVQALVLREGKAGADRP